MKREETDELAGGPPQPKLRDAATSSPSGAPPSIPRGSSQSSAAAAAMMGASPAMEMTESMATIEMMIKRMSKYVPQIIQVAQPFIAQMRDIGMAGLANLAQGGMGSVDMLGAGATPPPPGAVPPIGNPMAGGGGAGPGLMPMPPM